MERCYDATTDEYLLRIPGLNRQSYPAAADKVDKRRGVVKL